MSGHKAKKASSKCEPKPITVRIREVLTRQFSGNAREMASALQLPYLSVLRTLHGADPSSRLLVALVQFASVEAQWLLSGRSVQARDFGLSGDVHLLPISPVLLPAPSTQEVIPADWPRQPVISRLSFRDAYCFSIPVGNQALGDSSFPAVAGDLLVIQCASDPDAGSVLEWDPCWVPFLDGNGSRAGLGYLSEKTLRRAGDAKPRLRVGPDSTFGEASGLFKPLKRSATRYGVEADGVTTIFRDCVLGRVVAKICWQGDFQTVESIP